MDAAHEVCQCQIFRGVTYTMRSCARALVRADICVRTRVISCMGWIWSVHENISVLKCSYISCYLSQSYHVRYPHDAHTHLALRPSITL